MGDAGTITDEDYRQLAAFRVSLRRFLHFSEVAAREAGITPAQYQLMLIIRGGDAGRQPTIADIAGALLLRHHSVVELIDRAEADRLVHRAPDPLDARLVRIRLTTHGESIISKLAAAHKDELHRLRRENGISL